VLSAEAAAGEVAFVAELSLNDGDQLGSLAAPRNSKRTTASADGKVNRSCVGAAGWMGLVAVPRCRDGSP